MTEAEIDAEVARIEALSPEELDAEVRAMGGDPVAMARETKALIEKLWANREWIRKLSDREPCEFCGKPLATDEDGEMNVDDPRLKMLCHARSENGDICPVEQKRLDRIADQIEAGWDREYDPSGCPGCGGNCARACR